MSDPTTADPAQSFLSDLGRLDLGPDAHRELAELAAAGRCAAVQERMAELVAARLAQVEDRLAEVLAAQAAAGGLGGVGDATTGGATTGGAAGPLAEGLGLWRLAARLQAATRALAEPAGSGPCADDCPCSAAAAEAGTTYHFRGVDGPPATDTPPVVCTLDSVGDNSAIADRLTAWQRVLADATSREDLADGIAVTFRPDPDRAAELGRLLAAEYACCSFASYGLVIDGRGMRVEVRTPPAGRAALAAVFGAARCR